MRFFFLAALGLLVAYPTHAEPDTLDRQANSVEIWKRRLSLQLASKKTFPSNAPAEGGTARVVFVLDRTGNLVSSALVESTGSSELDAAALAMVEAAAPFPEPPADIEEDNLRFTVPVIFHAKREMPWRNPLPAEAAADEAKVNAKLHSICRGC
ncbi:TonB family protein [Bradyrhizobium sp. INPA01-394B]|uniref:TonB family protein n=1 Tax=Bradyrhizobium campsiandrae TaxID=1729892 RepID=A0ABR7U929_9BRAD|nr:TonB family protein [Bradyrhizobium campsiandrae]MBC9878419.1 TonB family protein [Bradyrhizobium campsiandrae]MBC9980343.1 TonB family protein [Bradyrhizobium campsiandrae]